MAQLIKLQNYITRYEWDIFRYPTQYIRLKQDNWKKLHYLWSNQDSLSFPFEEQADVPPRRKRKFFFRNKSNEETLEEIEKTEVLPDTEEELKHYFLNHLIPFQFKWATSTIMNVSFVDRQYYSDEKLEFFLKRFPDTYLLMYFPIFEIRKAPVEGEIILINPLGIEIIHMVEENPKVIIQATDDRSWIFDDGVHQKKHLSPVIALKRTEKIVKSILEKHFISFPIHKVILSRTNHINYVSEPYKTSIIGKLEYENWFDKKRTLSSPLKSIQLKAAEALLKHCQSSYVKRPEWEEENEQYDFFTNEGE
ncbi:NERD domain-containing protein [Ornithinibacillus halotolerans]|uniref:NERD domain-containing protein n=1 Tax=Ornithinibacillus halotolerans TaxID=1274357 RepID=A0A916WBA2_9BACI|nr:NERD domain-containing protein [Ornithinibacillus halotolerans]GGA82609.1 hypothetical protein GCM10008025_27240 [Ornithinibacillus halotolerans]